MRDQLRSLLVNFSGAYAFKVDGNLPHVLSINGRGSPKTYKHSNPPAAPIVVTLKENDLVDLSLLYWAEEGDVEVSMELLDMRAMSSTAFLGYQIFGSYKCLQMNERGWCSHSEFCRLM